MRSAAYHRPHLFQYTLQECAHVHVSRVLAHAYVRVRPLSRSPSLSLFFPLSRLSSLSLSFPLSLSTSSLPSFLSHALSHALFHTHSLSLAHSRPSPNLSAGCVPCSSGLSTNVSSPVFLSLNPYTPLHLCSYTLPLVHPSARTPGTPTSNP